MIMNFPFIESRNNFVGFYPANGHCCKILSPAIYKMTCAVQVELQTGCSQLSSINANMQRYQEVNKKVSIKHNCSHFEGICPPLAPIFSFPGCYKFQKLSHITPQAVTTLPLSWNLSMFPIFCSCNIVDKVDLIVLCFKDFVFWMPPPLYIWDNMLD